MQLSKRKTYLDVLRIMACFLVIFNHRRGYTAYQNATDIWSAFYYLVYTMFTRINVPLFFMISGSLLFSKDISYKDLFVKRMLRIVMALILASLVVYVVECRNDLSQCNVVVFMRKLFNGNHATAYWYLYAYLGLLLTLPFMRRIAVQFNCKDFLFIVGIHFVFSTFLPLFNYILSCSGIAAVTIAKDFSIPLMTTKAFFYPLIGYFLDCVFEIDQLNRKSIGCICAIGLAGIVLSSCFTYHQGVTSGYTQDFVQTFDYVIAIAVFVYVKYLFVKTKLSQVNATVIRAITLIGSLTFGIYLLDPVLQVFKGHFNSVVTTGEPILYSVCWCLFSMTIGGVITYGLKKVPVVRNIL